MQIICIIYKTLLECKLFAFILHMIFDALLASLLVAAASLIGALVFGANSTLARLERIIVPLAVGVFLSLAFYELIPETLLSAPEVGGIAIMAGFVSFYVLSNILHKRFHSHLEGEACDKKSAASLILIGDAIHNLADGFILGGAFLIDPAVGVATAIGLAIHEIPQEIVEFGILLRAGYSRTEAALRNLLSASSIVLGTLIIIFIAARADAYVWILTGFAAGNLLYLAASDLLPRIHGQLREFGGMNRAAILIVVGFAIMSGVITWTHETFGDVHGDSDSHGLEHESENHAEETLTEELHLDDHLQEE
jgi:zinc and cadmium transporter